MNVLLGVTGSIATYKACELVREFQKRECEVRVILTESAQQFVTKLTFESILNDKVYTNMFSADVHGNVHIELARWADVFIVAPATANILSKFASGAADDLLTTTYLACEAPKWIAPAMNTKMWLEPSVQTNVSLLKSKGNNFLEPGEGELACKEMGAGKMMEPEEICNTVIQHFRSHSKLQGKQILLTSGPTREYFDPVRFLSSPSSGKMGMALAMEAQKRGALVTLVHGPMPIDEKFKGVCVPVVSADEMFQSVKKYLPTDIFVSCAAVSDYRFDEILSSKYKKGQHELTVKLSANPDILQYVSREKLHRDFIVGFAAETQDVNTNARKKLIEKNLDWIVANQVFQEQKGFQTVETDVTMISSERELEFSKISKTNFAKEFWNVLESDLAHDRR